MPDTEKPKSIILSKRANVFYLEHVRVMQKDDRVIFITDREGDVSGKLKPYFNLPERNTVFVLLGKGSSITDAAARRLAAAGVVVGFSGSGGTPLFNEVDLVFMPHYSEYRPTQYMQGWARIWLDESARLDAAKELLKQRMRITEQAWCSQGLGDEILGNLDVNGLARSISESHTSTQLLAAEGRWAKSVYKAFASHYSLQNFKRKEGEGESTTKEDKVNALIDHGNYLAYGYSAAILCTLGISYAFPLLHGKTRRGGLVFDVADLIKDGYVLPTAFEFGAQSKKQKEFRKSLVDKIHKSGVLDDLFTVLENLSARGSSSQ